MKKPKLLNVHGVSQSFDGHRGGWTEGYAFTCQLEPPRDLPAVLILYPIHRRTRQWLSTEATVTLTVYAKTATEVATVAHRARRWFDPTTGGK